MKRIVPFFIILVTVSVFFFPLVLKGRLPVPADTIVGLYHPFFDTHASTNPRGVPYKNSLITDPVRQQYPWKDLTVTLEKQMQLPLWNPYQMSGVPLLGNFQSAAFYPLNILFFIFSFSLGWSLLIFAQPLLAGIFMYLYLRNLRLELFSALLGSLIFSFCGFSVAWMEWGTVAQTALWLPLVLLSIDKLFELIPSKQNSKFKIQNLKLQLKNKKLVSWSFVYLLAFVASFFAGHLQTFIYLLILSSVYFHISWWRKGKQWNTYLWFGILNVLFLLITAVQWLSTLQFLLVSARDVDLVNNWQNIGWFIPWQHLLQFFVPDFFGNPATGNYWGVWNYGELIGYIGIAPLILATFALFFRRDKKTLFFGTVGFVALFFALPTFLGFLPYQLHIPFLSTAQPTRLLFLVDFSLAVLAALGLDWFLKTKKKSQILYPLSCLAVLFGCLWILLFLHPHIGNATAENLQIAKRNLVFPTLFFLASAIIILFMTNRQMKKYQQGIVILLCLLTAVDLFRFTQKYETFSLSQYLFPQTKIMSFLQQHAGTGRIMETDPRILPPNFTTEYHLQSIDGYDPLYLKLYGEFIVAMQRGKPDISAPFGFNRIIQPTTYQSPLINLLGVKYILSLDELHAPNLAKVMEEGQTKVYENKNMLPRAFFVKQVIFANGKQDEINKLYEIKDYQSIATVETSQRSSAAPFQQLKDGTATITKYSENSVVISTKNANDGFLVLTDTYYPTWHVLIDNKEVPMMKTDYTFRGVLVPKGNHMVKFYDTLL